MMMPVSGFAEAGDDTSVLTTVVVSSENNLDSDRNATYYNQLLELALAKTVPSHGPYEIKRVPVITIETRLLREIERHRIDVTWLPYQKKANHNLRPVPVSLLKELSNYRVFLIRADDQKRFSRVKTLEDLRQLRGGIGAHWPDRTVMELNHLPLVVSVNYQSLFKMLAAGRFDYFSRGIYQALPEVNRFPELGLVLETDLILHYESPVYFYVNKDNLALAQRLEQGLALAIADGSFDEIFDRFPRLVWAQEQLARQHRRVIRLESL